MDRWPPRLEAQRMLVVGLVPLGGGLVAGWLVGLALAPAWVLPGLVIQLVSLVDAVLHAVADVGAVLVGGPFVLRALTPAEGPRDAQ
jgi:hypothetical protein